MCNEGWVRSEGWFVGGVSCVCLYFEGREGGRGGKGDVYMRICDFIGNFLVCEVRG